MHTLTRLLARVKRRERHNRPLRGRVIRRETLAEYSGQGRPTVLLQAITYENGQNRVVRLRA